MAKYLYSLVRCVPEPRTGEFVNIGAVAGDPESGDWTVRQVENLQRARRLADVNTIDAALYFINRIGSQVDAQERLQDDGEVADELTEAWLNKLHGDLNNVVQISRPLPVIASDAEAALDVVFANLLIDPARQPRGYIGKAGVVSRIRSAYAHGNIDPRLVHSRVEVMVGDRIHTGLDFALANGHAIQVTQAWSFQRASTAELSVDVKAWGYALNRLRSGDESRLIYGNGEIAQISADVPLDVVIAPPQTRQQREVYEEAEEIFRDLDARVLDIERVRDVAVQAEELLGTSAL